MGKITRPDPAPGGPNPRTVQGIAAYRSAMKPPDGKPSTDGKPQPDNSPTGGKAPAQERPINDKPSTDGKPPAGEGFLKTRETPETRSDPGNRENRLPGPLREKTGTGPAPQREGGDSKLRRVAKFLILIGGEEAAGILSRLDLEQVELISQEIASIRGISGEEASGIFEEFRFLLSSNYGFGGANSGGVETARRLLYAAFGPEKGTEYLNRALPQTRENLFSFLEEFKGEQIALLLKEESPGAAALILSRLPPKLSAETLINVERDRKTEIVKRIARLGQAAPEVLEQVAEALKEKARKLGAVSSADTVNVDGRGALAAILKQSDFSFGDRIIRTLDEEDPDLGADLKERLNTLEDVVKAEDRPLQEKLRSMADRDTALLLKGKSQEFIDKILSNVSAQRRAIIQEEIRIMGAVPRRDVDSATKSFLAWFRESREEGRILLIDDEDVVV